MTIRDIAEKAGVSVATVSRVMNNSGYVKEETRTKIEDIIKESNYRPNAVARSLIKKETSLIGLIMPNRVHPFFIHIIDGVESKAEEMGMNVLFYNTMDDQKKEHRALQKIMEQQVKGLLFLPVMGSDDKTSRLLQEIEAAGIPVVLIDREVKHGDFDAVFIDNKEAVCEATRVLTEAGHRKIGIITCPETVLGTRTRISGYLKGLKEAGISVREDYIFDGDFSQESGYQACETFMALADPPTAVLATSSSETLGCIRYLNKNGLEAGKDIGLIGFDDIATLNIIGYPVTVIDRPMKVMGERAYEMMMEHFGDSERGKRVKEMILNTKVILRGSEGCERL